jgi:DNA-binding transcriptional LysR family regulator
VRERKVDLVLTGVHGTISEYDIEVERLFDEPNHIVAGSASTWARRRRIDLADLVDAAWISRPIR